MSDFTKEPVSGYGINLAQELNNMVQRGLITVGTATEETNIVLNSGDVQEDVIFAIL